MDVPEKPIPHRAPDQPEVVFWDEENPLSVINMVPDPLRVQLEHLRRSDKAYLLDLTETDLYKALERLNQRPNPTDNRLRVKFWLEYDRLHETVVGNKTKMVCANITSRVCSREMFYRHYITNHPRLAWLLCPPASYMARMQEALNFGVDQVREILALPPEQVNREVRAAADMKIRLVHGLDQLFRGTQRRLRGRPKNVDREAWLNMALDDSPEIAPPPEQMTYIPPVTASEDDLLAQLQELEAKNRARAAGAPK